MDSRRSIKPHSDFSDAELVKQFCLGNEKVLPVLIYRHQSAIRLIIGQFVQDKDIQQDYFQDVIEKVMVNLRNNVYKEEGNFKAWMLRMCRNYCIDMYRKNKLYRTHSYDEYPVLGNFLKVKEPLALESLIKEEEFDFLRKCIEQLPDDQRDIIIFRYFYEMPFEEIAEYKGININTALGRMHYAILGLRKLIKKE